MEATRGPVFIPRPPGLETQEISGLTLDNPRRMWYNATDDRNPLPGRAGVCRDAP
jgi:hypothetical protein